MADASSTGTCSRVRPNEKITNRLVCRIIRSMDMSMHEDIIIIN